MNKFIISLCLTALLFGSASRAMDYRYRAVLGDRLIDAVLHRTLGEVGILLVQGAPVDAKDVHGDTPLICAARAGYKGKCRLLIENKAMVDAKTISGETPLILAAVNGNEAVCRLLVEKKAMIDGTFNYGSTPLFYAARFGREGACRFLIKNNALVDAKNKDGNTPLREAVSHGHEVISKLIIDAQLWRPKAPIITFLGIVRKRPENLPCMMHYDVAKMIACMVFDSGAIQEAVQKEKENIFYEIENVANYQRCFKSWKNLKQQLNSHKKVNQ